MSDRHPPASASDLRRRAALQGGQAAADLLRRAGCRPSPQRLLVLQALGGGGHVTAEEALAHARGQYPSINPSTVYRTLDALVEAGIARRSDLGAASKHYELARDHVHHHAVCVTCGAVAHFHSDRLRALAQDVAEATGFLLVRGRELTIHAICPACQAAARRRAALRPTPQEAT